MNFIYKLDKTAVEMIRYLEDVPILSKAVGLSLQFSKFVEPYVFSLLKHIPLNLTFYRRSQIYLYLDSKPYEELFARFWKGDAYVKEHRRSFDALTIKKHLECLNFKFFEHYTNDIKMISNLIATGSPETRKALLKKLDANLIKKIINENRSLIFLLPQELQQEPEYVYKACFCAFKRSKLLIDNLNDDINKNEKYSKFPADLEILSKNEENLKNVDFLEKLFICASEDKDDGCQWLLFSILINFEKKGEEFFKPFFASLAQVAKNPKLKNFFQPSTNEDRSISFASSLMLYFSPGISLKTIFKSNPKLFVCLDESWKHSPDFILQCLTTQKCCNYYDYNINLIDLTKREFFNYIDPNVLGTDYFTIIEKFIDQSVSKEQFYKAVEALFKSIHPDALTKKEFILSMVKLLSKYNVSVHNEIVEYIFGDGNKLLGTPLKHDCAMMNSLCAEHEWLLKAIRENVWKDIIKNDPNFIKEFKHIHLLLGTHHDLFSCFTKEEIVTLFASGPERITVIAKIPSTFTALKKKMPLKDRALYLEIFLTDEVIQELFFETAKLELGFDTLLKVLMGSKSEKEGLKTCRRNILRNLDLLTSKNEAIKNYVSSGGLANSLKFYLAFSCAFNRYFFNLLPDNIKFSPLFIKQCIGVCKTCKDQDASIFKDVHPSKIAPTENFEGYIELIKSLIEKNSQQQLFSFLSKEVKNDKELIKKIIDQFRGLNEEYHKSIKDLLYCLLSRWETNHDYILDLLKSEEIFFHCLPYNYLSYDHAKKWLVNFPWLIQEYISRWKPYWIENGFHLDAIKTNPAVLPWMFCNLKTYYETFENQNRNLFSGDVSLSYSTRFLIETTIVPLLPSTVSQKDKFSYFRDLCLKRTKNNKSSYHGFIDEFVMIFPELKFYVPEIIVNEYTVDGKAVPNDKLLDFWKGAISAGWHRSIPTETVKAIWLFCKSNKIPKIMFKNIVAQIMFQRIKDSCRNIKK